MIRYLFLNYNFHFEKSPIPPGPRIIKFDNRKMKLGGSYANVKRLTKYDEGFLALENQNQKRAELIRKEEHIYKVEDLVIVKDNDRNEVNLDYLILLHTISGSLKKKNRLSGLHFIPNPKPNWVYFENISQTDENGVFEAEVSILRNGKKSSTKKSSFFPNDWSYQRVFNECKIALVTKQLFKSGNRGTKYKSQTRCGIPVELWYDINNNFKTIYPLYKKQNT